MSIALTHLRKQMFPFTPLTLVRATSAFYRQYPKEASLSVHSEFICPLITVYIFCSMNSWSPFVLEVESRQNTDIWLYSNMASRNCIILPSLLQWPITLGRTSFSFQSLNSNPHNNITSLFPIIPQQKLKGIDRSLKKTHLSIFIS